MRRHGTGHGRAVVPEVADEVALVAVDAALLWIRWSLRRLHHIIKGQRDLLVHDLDEGAAQAIRGRAPDRLHFSETGRILLIRTRPVEVSVSVTETVGFGIADW